MPQADVIARQTPVDDDPDPIGDRQTTSRSIVCLQSRVIGKLPDLPDLSGGIEETASKGRSNHHPNNLSVVRRMVVISSVQCLVLKVDMLRKRLLWITQCLLFSLAGIFVAGRLSGLLNALVWWALHQSRTTFLQRSSFVAAYYLPLIGIYGLCLGLIPIHRLKELLASSFGKIEFQSSPRPELVFSRPLLWAWAPVGLVLAIRFLTFSTRTDQSVLFSATHGESRYEHFFAPLNLRSASNLSAWIFDRFVLTGPTPFLLTYTVGVWLRHQFPGPPSSHAEASR